MRSGTAAACYLGHEFTFKLLSLYIRRGIARTACMRTGQVTSASNQPCGRPGPGTGRSSEKTRWRKCSSYLAASNCELCRRSSLGVQMVEARRSKSNVGQALENSFILVQSLQAIAKAGRAVAYGGQLAYGSHCFQVRARLVNRGSRCAHFKQTP